MWIEACSLIIIFGNHVNKSEELRVDVDEVKELIDVCGLDCSFTDIGQKEIEENNLLIDEFIKLLVNFFER